MDNSKLEAAWPVDEPSPDFAQRTAIRVARTRARRRQRTTAAALVAVAMVAAAVAVVFWPQLLGSGSGSKTASGRETITLSRRATAVLEPGASVSWRGDSVDQPRGEVFYRVDGEKSFKVATPAGTVEVVGTCFRVQVGSGPAAGGSDVKREVLSASGGAVLAALAIVTVYEGKVQLSSAKERVTLGAGESGRLGPDGAKKLDPDELAAAQAALKGDADPDKVDLSRANDSLAGDIASLNRRLKGLEAEKAKLQRELLGAETELARRTDGKPPRDRNEFDLDQEDWAGLAESGTIKYRVPCMKPDGWSPPADKLDALGLSPDDAESIRAAYQKSYERLWPGIEALCMQAIGKKDVVQALGPDTCTHVVMDAERRKDAKGAIEAMRQLAELRAGTRAAVDPAVAEHPVYKLFSSLTSEMPRFESDLAQSFGPAEAKRLAYAEGMCGARSTFGGPGPREK